MGTNGSALQAPRATLMSPLGELPWALKIAVANPLGAGQGQKGCKGRVIRKNIYRPPMTFLRLGAGFRTEVLDLGQGLPPLSP